MKVRAGGMIVLASLVVLLDEVLKWAALARGWTVHKNLGIAFDIPLRGPLVIGLTVLIGVLLLITIVREWRHERLLAAAALVILLGGAGNLFDRLVYGFTVDYLILFGRSAFNLSDLVILGGMVAFLFASRKHPHPLR